MQLCDRRGRLVAADSAAHAHRFGSGRRAQPQDFVTASTAVARVPFAFAGQARENLTVFSPGPKYFPEPAPDASLIRASSAKHSMGARGVTAWAAMEKAAAATPGAGGKLVTRTERGALAFDVRPAPDTCQTLVCAPCAVRQQRQAQMACRQSEARASAQHQRRQRPNRASPLCASSAGSMRARRTAASSLPARYSRLHRLCRRTRARLRWAGRATQIGSTIRSSPVGSGDLLLARPARSWVRGGAPSIQAVQLRARCLRVACEECRAAESAADVPWWTAATVW